MSATAIRDYRLLALRIFDRPLAIEQRALKVILRSLAPRFPQFEMPDVSSEDLKTVKIRAMFDNEGDGVALEPPAPYEIDRGVAIVDVMGPLVHRNLGILEAWCGMRSYETLTADIETALADPDVGAILLRIDSPGGEVSGLAECADGIFAARKSKPVYAIAEDMAASAAYYLGSAAEKLYTTQGGIVGSIGAVWTHVDYSNQLAKEGVVVTHVYAGERKVDGTPYAPLVGDAKAAIQSEISAYYEIFTGAVARHRGMAQAAVKATEAGVFIGEAGIKAGLADGIRTVDQVIAELATASLHQPPKPPKELSMKEIPLVQSDPSEKSVTATAADLDELATLRAEKQAELVAKESERTAKREAVLAKHAVRLKPATMASMKETLDAIKDPEKVDAILSKIPTETNAKPTGSAAAPAGGDAGGSVESDPELELLSRAEKLHEESLAKNPKKPLGMRAALDKAALADPALAKRVGAQRERSLGPKIQVEE